MDKSNTVSIYCFSSGNITQCFSHSKENPHENIVDFNKYPNYQYFSVSDTRYDRDWETIY